MIRKIIKRGLLISKITMKVDEKQRAAAGYEAAAFLKRSLWDLYLNNVKAREMLPEAAKIISGFYLHQP